MESVITFQNHPVIWCLVVFVLLAVLVAWCMAGMLALKHAPLREDLEPAPEASAGPSATEGYIEPPRTAELRKAYAARRATREEILAAEDQKRAMALIRDAGGC